MGRDKKAISFLKGMIIFLIGIVVGLLLLTIVLNISDKKDPVAKHEINGDVVNQTTAEPVEVTTEDNFQPITEEPTTEAIATADNPEKEEKPANNAAADPNVEATLSKMSLHDKVCQMFVVTPEALTGFSQVTEFGDTSKSSFDSYPVGGLIYFSQNIESEEQLKTMLTNTQSYAKEKTGIPVMLSVDEEGGSVARCADKIGSVPKLEPMFNYKDQGTEKAYDNAKTVAGYLKNLGFNMDFAPIADTWTNPSNTVIGKRAYSDNYNQASELVASAVKGYEDTGIRCTLKHFPGHGDTAQDSHAGTATTSRTLEELSSGEYLPFKSGIDAGAGIVMVGHITVTSVTQEPASISKDIVTGELRNKLGYDGVVVTDALNMGAISNNYSSGEAAVKCIQAGDDLLLMPADFKASVSAVEEAVKNGTISEERINESVRRILKLKLKMQ